MMRIFIPSTGHIPRMLLMEWISHDWPVTIVVHDSYQHRRIRSAFPWLDRKQIIVSGLKDGLVGQRNFICEELVKRNEWYIGMDDDIQGINTVCKEVWDRGKVEMSEKPPRGYKTWRQAYRVLATPQRVMRAFEILRDRMEYMETIYGGFASIENPFFRTRKWSEVKHVRSNVYVAKNTREYPWHGKCGHDTCRTVETVARYGCVGMLNYVHALHKPYVEGGLGDREWREPILMKHFKQLVEAYPGLVKLVEYNHGSHVRMIRTTKRSCLQWKKEHPNARHIR